MRCVGIIAEYNPFHNGHRYHIAEAKRLANAEAAVVIMSGDFVQRGEPAVADKFTRAIWALRSGADMVIELPEVFSVACAERFASGAVRILAGSGLLDALCFGSESGDLGLLRKVSESEPDPNALRAALALGQSYPKAMASAGAAELGPNDTLGLEYLRAVKKHSPSTEVFAIKRVGGAYDEGELNGEFSSAAAIRRALAPAADIGRMSERLFDSLNAALPRDVLSDIAEQMRKGLCPALAARLSDAVISRFRSMSAEEIAALPEVAEGLENLFIRHSVAEGDIDRMLSAVKSKRYTMARLKRISMSALLGITEALQGAAAADDGYLYARVLGMAKGAEGLASRLVSGASIPVIMQAADRNALGEKARSVLEKSALAHRLHALARPYERGADEDSSHRLTVV